MNDPVLPLIKTLRLEHTHEIGTLSVNREGQRVSLPLAAQHIFAKAAGCVAEVTVEQSFQNPFQEFLEAVYVFPLGGGAAVSAFELKAGGRTLKGIVKERGEAREAYRKALEGGRRAALLEQERDNVFTVQVGNLPPGEEVSVRIVYSECLTNFEDGTTELRLPLVVAPRYIPGEPVDGLPVGAGVEPDTDAVPDASRITPPRLAPGFDPRVALSIEVELAGGGIQDLACSQHALKLSNGRISLSREDEHLNRDFVLRWRHANAVLQPRLLVNRDGYAMLTIIPPHREGSIGAPRDVVFVLDRSGSMGGVKMASASRACSILLSTLGPRDNFAVCAFSDSTEWMEWTAADEAGIAAGGKFLRNIVAGGGTELDPAIKETFTEIRNRPEPIGREPVIVLITDGEVGNESDIFKRLQRDKAGVRVFTIGIDSAVNDAFLRRLAALGGGTCTLCAPGEGLEQALSSVGREIGVPLFTDVGIEGADLIAPSHVPDLFAGRAVTAFFVGRNLKNVRVRMKSAAGDSGNAAASRDVSLNVSAEEIDMPAISHLWARARVTDLEDRFRLGEKVKQEIIDLSVKHTLLTRFTAFVVVDESEVVNEKGEYRSVVQPVEMPDLWELQAPTNVIEKRTFLGAVGGRQIFGALERSTPTQANSLFGAKFGSRESWDMEQPYTGSRPAAPKAPSTAQRAAIEKAMAMLASALKDARDTLDSGKLPTTEPIEKARQALIQAISKVDSIILPRGLQQFLRHTLFALITAIESGRPDEVGTILERTHTEFDSLTRRGKFWEASV